MATPTAPPDLGRPLRDERVERMRRQIRRPPTHWMLLAFCLFVLTLILVVQGIATHTTGNSGTATASDGAGSPLAGGPAVFAYAGGRLVPAERPPGRRIALTFDDGPDPRWTTRIESVLLRDHVPATFFVVGSNVVRHPGVVRDLHRHGFDIGNHTFSHVELSAVPAWDRALQLGLTETAVAGSAGVKPRLLRPPYSSEPDAVAAAQLPSYTDAARQGYLVVLADFDSRDWARPGTGAIVRNATPPSARGGIVMMHDGGGDRAETVAALTRLIPRLRRRGFQFVRVADLANVRRAALSARPSGWERTRGKLLVAALSVAGWITAALTFVLAPIAALALLRALALVLLARRHVRRKDPAAREPFLPPVSFVVPAFNEAVGIERAVRSLVGSEYPEFEVVVVDDGSTDTTGEIVESLALERVRVIHQPNSGKAAALNTGVRAAAHSLVVTVDGDTVFEPGTLRALVEPMRDPAVGAVAGNTKVGNRRGLIGRWQHIEYVMGFNLDRRLYDVLQCMPTVPGAIGAFRREALADIGGVSGATLAEDTDITIAIGRAGWRVVYAQDARAWTEAPASLGALWRQRYRWSFGTMQAVWKHKAAALRRDEARLGWVGLPYLVLFQITLPLLAPLIDVFALYGLVFLDPLPLLAFWAAFNLLSLGLAVYAFRLDEESLRPLWALPLQQFVYRQLMYLVVLESVISAVLGTRIRWQHVARTGDVEAAPSATG